MAPTGYELDTTPAYVYYAQNAGETIDGVANIEKVANYVSATKITTEAAATSKTQSFHSAPLTSENQGVVTFTKLGQTLTTSAALPGCTFELIDQAGKIKTQTVNSVAGTGEVKFTNVDPGTYTLRETVAPSIYSRTKDKKVTVTANQDGTYTYAITPSNNTTDTALAGNAVEGYTVTNSYGVGGFIVNKQDAKTGEALKGAEFTLTDITEKLVAGSLAKPEEGESGISVIGKFTTAASTDSASQTVIGQAAIGNLVAGRTYRLTETGIPSGYKPDTTVSYRLITLSVDSNNQVHTVIKAYDKNGEEITTSGMRADLTNTGSTLPVYTIKNDPIDTSGNQITAITKDDQGQLLKNVTFSMYRKVGDKVYNQPNDTFPIVTAISDEQGQVTFRGMEYGDYVIETTGVPAGFDKAATKITVTKTELDAVMVDGTFVYSIPDVYVQTAQRGTATIQKQDSYTNKRLSGAEFTIYQGTDAAGRKKAVAYLMESSEKGTYILSNRNRAGQVLDTKTVDGAGYLINTGTTSAPVFRLLVGDYEIRETVAPENYILDEKVYSFTVNANTESYITNDNLHTIFYNDEVTGNLMITKKIEQIDESNTDGAIHTTTDTKGGAGFVFRISGTSAWGNSIANQISSSSSRVVVDNGLSAGGAGYAQLIVAQTNPDDVQITTDSTGVIAIHNLEKGSYIITELESEATEPYTIAESRTCEIGYDAAKNDVIDAKVDIANHLKRSNIVGQYQNAFGTKTQVEGAVVGIFPEGTTTFTTDKLFQGMTAVTQKDGTFRMDALPYGTYVLAELKAPLGQLRSRMRLFVRVTENGTSIEKTTDDKKILFTSSLATMNFSLYSVDAETGALLLSTQYKLVGKDLYGQEMQWNMMSDASGKLSFENIPAGTYTLSVAEREGYEKTDDFVVTVTSENDIPYVIFMRNNQILAVVSSENSTKTYEIEEVAIKKKSEKDEQEAKENVQTGDQNHIGRWLAIMAVSALVGLLALIVHKKNKNK